MSFKGYHFTEGGGVHASLVGITDISGTQVGIGHETIDERRLAYARIAAEQGYLTLQQRAQGLYSVTRLSRDSMTLVANGLIEVYHHLLVAALVVIQLVALIKYKYYRHTIGLSRSQKAVDKGSAGLWTCHSDNQQSLVDVGSEDVTLLGEVDGLADDIVLTILYLRNPAFVVDGDMVAHGHRISGADSLDAEIALHLTIKELAIVRQDSVPASCILNNETFHSSLFTFH